MRGHSAWYVPAHFLKNSFLAACGLLASMNVNAAEPLVNPYPRSSMIAYLFILFSLFMSSIIGLIALYVKNYRII